MNLSPNQAQSRIVDMIQNFLAVCEVTTFDVLPKSRVKGVEPACAVILMRKQTPPTFPWDHDSV